jgi:uncharacterized protein
MTSADVAGQRAEVTDGPMASHRSTALITFVALAFGWTWGFWWVASTAASGSATVLIALTLLSGTGPSLSAAAVVWRFDGTTGLRHWLRRCFNWRLALGWYGLAFFGPPLIMLGALVVHGALGGAMPPSPATGNLWLSVLIIGQILVLGGPLGEEFGWRGYALPALARKWGWRWASLSVGVVWALWHLPLFYMPGTAQAAMPMALFMASSVALSVIFARLSVNTAFSVLPAIVLHWSVNAWSWVIPVTPQGGVMQPYYLVMGLVFVIAIFVFLKPGPHPPPRGLHQ